MTLETKLKRDALRKRMRTSRLMLSEKALRDAESHIFEKVITLSLLIILKIFILYSFIFINYSFIKIINILSHFISSFYKYIVF